MTSQDELLNSLTELIGSRALAKLRAEFGGTQLYIPALAPVTTTFPMPTARLCAKLDAATPLSYAVSTLAGAAVAMNSLGVTDLVVEVETAGVGQDVLERLSDALGRQGIKVQPMELPR